MTPVRRFVRDHSLAIVTLGAFLALWLGGQAWAGHRSYNDEQRAHGEPAVTAKTAMTAAILRPITLRPIMTRLLRCAGTTYLCPRRPWVDARNRWPLPVVT